MPGDLPAHQAKRDLRAPWPAGCAVLGDHVVLDGVELDVAEGSAYALRGPNGSGKTTMVQILPTLIAAECCAATCATRTHITFPAA